MKTHQTNLYIAWIHSSVQGTLVLVLSIFSNVATQALKFGMNYEVYMNFPRVAYSLHKFVRIFMAAQLFKNVLILSLNPAASSYNPRRTA